MGPDSPTKSEAHKNENFICFAGDQTDEQAVANGPDVERPKSQSDELVEVNLADEKEEP